MTVLCGLSYTLAEAREGWLRQYSATKRIVEGLLLRARREAEYTTFFKDLQVGEAAAGEPLQEQPAATEPETPAAEAQASATE